MEADFIEWAEINITSLEEDFINEFPPEERPLDDDISDFINDYAREFEGFCLDLYNKR